MKEKMSASDAQALLKQAAASIRTLLGQRDEALAKAASYEREERIRSIADEMEAKKLYTDMDRDEKLASLRDAEDLDVTEQAVKMASPQGFAMGDLGDIPGGGDSEAALTTFVMTGETPAE